MTNAERGKMGGLKTKEIIKKRIEEKIFNYYEAPNHCENCHTILDYEKKSNKFCGKSCSAVYNNTRKVLKITKCKNCETEIVRQNTYCGIECYQEAKHKLIIKKWKDEGVYNRTIRRYIIEKFNNTCSCCGNSEWMGKPMPLEVEHIDGNSENNSEDNLTVLCPNCHSQTSTYKGKNRGNGRHNRRLRYESGKSY